MKHQKFSVIETKKNNRTLYGMQITDTSGKKYRYEHIAETKEDIELLISQMSATYISPVHFADIISDFITLQALEKISCINT